MTVLRQPSSALATHLENVKFSHSVFALPFAVAGACLAARDRDAGALLPDARTLVLVVLAAVAARTCAMSANRLADAALDARNPRTAGRPVPSGRLSRGSVALVAVTSAIAFQAIAWWLGPLCAALAPAVLAVLVGYSWTKRFTSLAHVVLGLSLGLAPAGAWLAVQGDFRGTLSIPIVLELGVVAWVAGFDLVYACQDASHDRASGLHSIPARLGVRRALAISAALHAAAVVLFAATGTLAGRGLVYFATVGVVALLLVVQHRMVRPEDLSRVDAAFFTVNGWVGVGFTLGLLTDLALVA